MALIGAPGLDTWPRVLQDNASRLGANSKAIRYKHYGIWQAYSWQEYLIKVKYLALGLRSLGFEADDRLLIVGENSPEWYFAQMAAQCNRGISVGLYSDLSATEIERIALDSGAAFAMIEDEEQADKITEIRDRLPLLKTVVFWRYKGLAERDRSMFMGMRDVMESGREYEAEHPGAFEGGIAGGDAGDVCSIVYTSGTGAQGPKGTLHTYDSLMASSRAFCEADGLGPKDNLTCYLPPAWIAEQWLGFGVHLLSGGTLNLGEGIATYQEDIREVAPDFVVYNARLWEGQAARVQTKMRGAGRLKRLATGRFIPVGHRLADLAYEGRSPGFGLRLMGILGDRVVFRPIRDSLGLPNARVCYTSGSTLSAGALRFFHALKVPLKNAYGSAEAGAVSGAYDTIQLPDTVGTVNSGVEIRVTERGEMVVRHPGAFLGYQGDPAGTAEVLVDGWVHTGDMGDVTEGGVVAFIDRIADLITLPRGDVLSPQGVESRLKSSPYIKDAWVLVGEGCDSLSTVVVIDAATTGRWADQGKVHYTTFADLSQHQAVYSLIEQEIMAINQDLSENERIDMFVNLPREFDPDEMELTRDRKLRRTSLAEKYQDLVEALGGGVTSVTLESRAAAESGAAGTQTTLRIATVGREGR